ncbi:2-oxoglutarate-dependent dioxygenase [Quillaja saponaria]|uniref:2-oxoglutarate-dependent dioxygenase n=1 Tax=Quillaja saponaria TaxID=32244 RepID=A0AAD7L825_QUISA|nr:2-oxoglutarate-dependent dioxygenase [Quillaja saponaria]
MMGETNGCIPVINLQEFPNPAECKKLREACEERGCFRFVNHKISLKLIAEMKNVMSSLLELPMKIEKQNKTVIPGSGYILPGVISPIFEGLGLYEIGSSRAVQEFCSKLEVSPNQREIIEKYGQALQELARDIERKLVRRFLTILHENEKVSVLEVMDRCGAYVPVQPFSGTLFVNPGDLANAWSYGMFETWSIKYSAKKGIPEYQWLCFSCHPQRQPPSKPRWNW